MVGVGNLLQSICSLCKSWSFVTLLHLYMICLCIDNTMKGQFVIIVVQRIEKFLILFSNVVLKGKIRTVIT